MKHLQLTDETQKMTDDLIVQIKKSETTDRQTKLLDEMGQHLQGWHKVENISVWQQCKILYEVWRVWNNLNTETISHWNYDFYNWAKYFTSQNNTEPAKQTIDNKISVYRDFVAECVIDAPDKVEIPIRDANGNMTGDCIEIEPDFNDCPYSKLLQVRGKARNGEMTNEAWSALFDDGASVRDLQDELNFDKQWKERGKNFRIYEQDGIIYAYQDGDNVALAHLLVENEDKPLWGKGIEQLLKSVRCHTKLEYVK